MKRTPLIISVILNVVLLVGIFALRSYFRKTMFEMAVISTEAETSLIEGYLKVLTSDDPNRIEVLEERLKINIENGKKAAEMWRLALQQPQHAAPGHASTRRP